MLSNQAIKDLRTDFNQYIDLLMDFCIREKAELNEFYQEEELLREEIINQLKDIKSLKCV